MEVQLNTFGKDKRISMCGFAGALILTNKKSKNLSQWLSDAATLLYHRGPDAGGYFTDGPLSLAARRLRIHDLEEHADQPMHDSSGRYCVVFNGSIFNYKEIRKELKELNIQFKTESDTEVVLYSLATWGKEAFQKFDGMFSIVFYDKLKKKIVIGRDKLGIKPFHYFLSEEDFIFSSEIKPILAHPSVKCILNREAVSEFFTFQALLPPLTLFKNIFVLEPGKGIEIEINNKRKPSFFSYWKLEEFILGSRENKNSVEESLKISLERCWNADRNIGIQLSGGVDSSLITAYSYDYLNKRKMNTYSIIFDDEAIKYYLPRSEEKFIDVVSKKFGVSAEKYMFSSSKISSAFAESIWYHEQPLNGPSTCLYMLLAKEIREKITVLLTGEGADDIFLGYFANWSFTENYNSLFKQFINNHNIKNMFGDKGLESALWSRIQLSKSKELSSLSSHGKATILTIKSYLHALLARHDRMFMSSGIEGRPPFCTDELLLARFGLDDINVQDGKVGKIPIKNLAKKYFSDGFVNRKKIGFSSPFGDWCSDPNYWRGYYDRLSLEFVSDFSDVSTIIKHQKMLEGKEKWSGQLLNCIFSWINFQTWYQIFFESEDIKMIDSWKNISNQATIKS